MPRSFFFKNEPDATISPTKPVNHMAPGSGTAEVNPESKWMISGPSSPSINVAAIVYFTFGLFSYFTSPGAFMELPGAPFLCGSVLLFTALVVITKVFKRFPKNETADE